MSTLKVANVHLDSTANNRVQYVGSNTVAIVAGGANTFIANASVTAVQINSSNALIANSSATVISVAGTPELTINTTASVFGGTVADSTGIIRPLVTMTANTVSGTTVDFTGIPSWVKRITVMFSGVSTSGTSVLQIQLGTTSGFETSGYLSQASTFNNTPGGVFTTTGLALTSAGNAGYNFNGIIPICLVNTNSWMTSGVLMTASGTTTTTLFAGSKTLSGTLTQVRVTTVNGTDTFDAGSVNIMYE